MSLSIDLCAYVRSLKPTTLLLVNAPHLHSVLDQVFKEIGRGSILDEETDLLVDMMCVPESKLDDFEFNIKQNGYVFVFDCAGGFQGVSTVGLFKLVKEGDGYMILCKF